MHSLHIDQQARKVTARAIHHTLGILPNEMHQGFRGETGPGKGSSRRFSL